MTRRIVQRKKAQDDRTAALEWLQAPEQVWANAWLEWCGLPLLTTDDAPGAWSGCR